MNATTSFKTDSASRYLGMLCNHFGKKVEAECSTHTGWVQFPIGRCDLSADDSTLELLATAEDQTQLDQVVHIITSHLERFAFRENPILTWRTPSN